MTQESKNKEVSILNPRVILLSSGISASLFLSYRIFNRYFRRIQTYLNLTPNMLNGRRKLYGKVTRVGDGDNFRFFHTPGGPWLGWGWLRKVPEGRTNLQNETLMIRLCGVDAPERAHFGKPAQPFSEESLIWLQNYLLNRSVTITPYSIDQYKRLVARVQVWKLTGRKDVSAEMLRNGIGVVYEAKTGAQFGGNESWYRKLELQAKKKKRGLWMLGNKLVTPGQFKKSNF